MKDHVRIVVCGDAGVGKTSIIKTLVSETFDEKVPPVIPPITVPPEVSPEHVSVSIVDTPSPTQPPSDEDPARRSAREEEIRRANVIILVYDVSVPETLDNASRLWLPKFAEMNLRVPVILVGNKTDVRDHASEELGPMIRPIMEKHRELDVCIECSAKQLFNIAEVFFFAQKAVLHPTTPLYDVVEHTLKPRATAALKRIFKLCDKDHDGKLSDMELNEFQYRCFSVHLKPEELDGVKNVVREACPQGLEPDSSLNLEGFIFLHTLFIRKGRLETTWTVIRKFGYDDDLLLSPEYTDTSIHKSDDQNVELSDAGAAFLAETFRIADTDKDGLLSPEQLDDLFSPCPEHPWSDKTRWVAEAPGKPGYWTRDAFLARWAMYLLDDPEAALLTLVYIGFAAAPATAVNISRRRRRDRFARSVSRNVFRCYVLGAPSTGKTELVRGLVGKSFGGDSGSPEHTVGSVSPVPYNTPEGKQQTKTLALLELPEARISQLLSSKAFLDAGDLAAIVYDVSDASSFEYAARLYENITTLRKTLPCVFIGAKADLPPAVQTFEVSPVDFCVEHKLPEPVLVSMQAGEDQNIYQMLVEVGMNPDVACPDYYSGEAEFSAISRYMVYGVAGIGLASLAYVGWKMYSSSSSKKATTPSYHRRY